MNASAPQLALNFSFSKKHTAIKPWMTTYINAHLKWAVCEKTGLCRDTIMTTIPVWLQIIIICSSRSTHLRVWLIWSRWGPTAIPEAADISTNCCSCVLNCLSFLIFISLWTKVFAIKYNINIWSVHEAIIWLQKTFNTSQVLRPQCWETKKSIWSNYLK